MKVLLDTHAFLWLIEDAPQLSNMARKTFSDTECELYFSAASYWEICIKLSLGKLRLAADWENAIARELKQKHISPD